ncbi:alcohol dehydrogenase [Streptantibioticus cattleyicolor NRRL 8057 = DSM 46488]|uniref:Alcohol dehydrogenase n=2 Tax=Kitasatosporales TaxID=85011 RepID=F8JYM5_STREN|nr:NADP-dependent oxidoreductase [Streptantibioticus cattleyicolor]AEW97246.1 alcohol dehydrogenase [Streptantibioticus cattleyicolor NRRL 8057 = DSM 46488]MYS61700.1 zinc-binding dehydrogenase [Streptomyces sp. SID5468]CCB77568.1 Alcohol dehydrogenase GroES domain protein [Streptantibioticus cattleyicolor NRRL 8057 = DSM 46488]
MHSYGGPDHLELADVPEPKVGPDTVLVRTRAAGVNPVDWKIGAGHLDAMLNVYFPFTPGWDLAGEVVATGPGVTEFAPGDEVFGYVRQDYVQHGTYAELAAAPVRTLARKPASLDWRQAAALPLAGLTAYQSLREAGAPGKGETVLVHAAAGGVGTFAVQIAVAAGARVIGTAGERNHDFLRSLGAEPVTYGDGLTDRIRALAPDGVDAAVDFVGGDAVAVSRAVLAPGSAARLVSVVDGAGVTAAGGRYLWVRPDATDLAALGDLADQGKLTVPIERAVPLERTAEAWELSASGHVRGKIVLTVS